MGETEYQMDANPLICANLPAELRPTLFDSGHARADDPGMKTIVRGQNQIRPSVPGFRKVGLHLFRL